MAKKDKRSLIGYDPLAWMQDDNSAGLNVADSPHESSVVQQDTLGHATAEVSHKLKLQASQTIQNVSELHGQLLTILNSSENSIEIDASAVNVVDTATLQLMVALKHEMLRLNREMIIDFPSDKFIEASKLLGLSSYLGTDSVASGFF